MAENANVIRGINWRETFPFTNIFRAFRIAIHPSKLILGLLAPLLLYVAGRVLDGIWPTSSNAVPGMPVVATPVINPFTGQPLPGGAADVKRRHGQHERSRALRPNVPRRGG